MTGSKIVAILTGAIALILSIAYLILVQILDFRGEMLPAPQSQLDRPALEYPAAVALHPTTMLSDAPVPPLQQVS